MILTCPACATRYLIDPRALGVTGRSVRCMQCSHVWMQLPPEDAPRRVDLPLPGMAPPTPPRALPSPAPVAAAPPPPPPIIAAPPVAPRPAMAMAGAVPPDHPRQIAEEPSYPDQAARNVARGGYAPIVILAILILALGGLWFGREPVMDTVPALVPAYAALGLADGGDPSADLEFRQVTSDRQQQNGRATLVIKGEVANVSPNSRHVPPLRITLEDGARHAIKSWTVVATPGRLRPGATVAFQTSVADPGEKTVGASVSFDSGTD